MLELLDITKRFGKVEALKNVSITVKPGEVVGLVGENGAGKSTLMKVLNGINQPDAGEIRIHGKAASISGPKDAAARGIGMVFQEQSLVPNLTAAENIVLGSEGRGVRRGVYRWETMRKLAQEQLDKIGSHIDPLARTESLSFADRQMVEIAKVLRIEQRSQHSPVIILDEPTSVLESKEIETLFTQVRRLREFASVIFVSHRLDEVFELCDRVTVLRDGVRVGTHEIGAIDRRSLIEQMLGEMEGARAQAEHEHAVPGAGAEAVRIEHLHVPGCVEDVSLTLESGIVTGLAGQVGSGASEVLRALGGLIPDAGGTVSVRGKRVVLNTPRRAVDAGVLYVPNDRQREGLFLGQSVERNLTVTRLRRVSRAR